MFNNCKQQFTSIDKYTHRIKKIFAFFPPFFCFSLILSATLPFFYRSPHLSLTQMITSIESGEYSEEGLENKMVWDGMTSNVQWFDVID